MAEQPPSRDDHEVRKERPSSPTTPLPDRKGDQEHPKGWRVQPAPDGRGMPPQKPPGLRALGPRFIWFVVILLALNLWISSLIPSGHDRIRVPYSPTFLTQVKRGNVKSISSTGTTIQGEFQHEFRYPPTGKGSKVSRLFNTEVPTFANTDALTAALQSGNVQVNAKPAEQGRSFLANLLLGFGPTLLLVGLFIWFARRAARQGAGGGLMGFGRSGARRVEPSEQTVTFEDVAGIDEAKQELTEIVDFLRNPDKYRRLGGRIPRGVLLSGPPGTGKTLLARAVAGEAHAPFFSISASEFVEAIVGVGASRVRDLFKQAKEAAPAIIFIDELDAIGRSRTAGSSFGGNDEREQTLNQILTEMDGFDTAIGVIVLAATNRPEILDPALLRPGRFDRRVMVQPPDTVGRRLILDVHTRSVPLADDVDLDSLASTTIGMVGADLANLVNEAALMAARREHEKVTMNDFTDALERLVLGSERKIVQSESDRQRTAYHESGHALVGMLTPGADPVRKVSIIPRGPALGVTLSAPAADRFSYDIEYLLGRIKVALGGRAAERLVFGDLTTGAESDLEQLTGIARQMVGRWGMSEAIGPIAVIPRDSQGPLLPGTSEVSEETHRLIDEEVRRLVDRCDEDVRRVLSANREKLDSLV
ncbi:MAG: cell division protease FtsH, partial [Thermoleophilaceae bacterium]|nr:cell division protease FtsH [Thermoleophilaceae bacterium]